MRVVIKNWWLVVRLDAGRGTEARAEVTLEDPPSVIAAVHNRGVHLLPRPLSDVRDPLLTGDAVEAETTGCGIRRSKISSRPAVAPKNGLVDGDE